MIFASYNNIINPFGLRIKVLLILTLLSTNLIGQTKLNKDVFYPKKVEFPSDYKGIVGNPKGWKIVGFYNLESNKVEKEIAKDRDTLEIFTPYSDGFMYLKIKGHNIVSKGDKKGKSKIVFVNNDTLILEGARIWRTKSSSKLVKGRALYIKLL